MLLLVTELPILQQSLLTSSLTPSQWLACFLLAAALPVVVEIDKAVRRRRHGDPEPLEPTRAVSSARALPSAPPAQVTTH